MAHQGGAAIVTGPSHAAAEHEPGHPGVRLYIDIAIVLTIITSLEVAVWYIKWMHHHHLLAPVLLILSAVKFVLVVGIYMHLKFDDRRFTVVFAFGLFVAIGIVLALYTLFKYHELVVHRLL